MKWPKHRLNFADELRSWAQEDTDLCLLVTNKHGSVAFFKSEIDECVTDDDLLEMLHKRLDTPPLKD